MKRENDNFMGIFMKKKVPASEAPQKPKSFSVNDRVITPISTRPGYIIKMEETPWHPDTIFLYGNPPKINKTFTVKLNFPALYGDYFKEVEIKCTERDLKHYV